jgi:hypothetical protein
MRLKVFCFFDFCDYYAAHDISLSTSFCDLVRAENFTDSKLHKTAAVDDSANEICQFFIFWSNFCPCPGSASANRFLMFHLNSFDCMLNIRFGTDRAAAVA